MGRCGADGCENDALFSLTDYRDPRDVCADHLAPEVAMIFESQGIGVVDVERAPRSGAAMAELAERAEQ